MKRNKLYIILAVLGGIVIGGLIFGGLISNDDSAEDEAAELAQASTPEIWTCSMHPQIKQPDPGDCPICGMDLIPAESKGAGISVNDIKLTATAMALANIQTTRIGSATSKTEDGMIALSGKIATNEENNSVQSSYFDGRIENLNVSYEGQEISRGQLLATLYAPTLVAAQQELLTTAALKETQPALYRAVRNKLKNWKLSEAQIDAIETSGQVRENFPIYATVSGTVYEVLAREGDYVNQGQPILKVSNLNSVWAEFDAYESQIRDLKKGQKIKVTANAYPDKEFEATISFIDPLLNNATRTVTVRATLNNKNDLFKPGMFVTAKIQSTATLDQKRLAVPASAVLWTGERSVVYVKTDENAPVFQAREVKLGSRQGDDYLITDGLQGGDVVVTNGVFTVDAAAQLQGKPSMMNQGELSASNEAATEMELDFPVNFKNAFAKVIPPYLEMKDALVEGDVRKITIAAEVTLQQLRSLERFNLGIMETKHFTKSLEMLQAIIDNELLENQRTHFVLLNENLVPIAVNSTSTDTPFYVQRCTMANDNKGANWISDSQEIRNPYYGDQMLSCGSVIDTIQ